MQAVLPDDIKVSFEFDQSPTVTRAMWSVVTEGLMGAVLTGLMVLLFLRDWRSVIVVVLNIPFALCGALIALWLTGQTINIMTLGGLALAIGILVDESTVEVENIHHQMEGTVIGRPRRAARQPADGHSPAPGDALRARRLHPVVLHAGGRAGAVRAAVAGRRVCDGDLVSPLQHLRPRPLNLAAAAPSPPPGGGGAAPAFPVRAGPRRLRPGRGRCRRLALAGGPGVSRGHARRDRPRRRARSAWRSSPGSTPGGSSSASGRRPGRGIEETEKLAIAALETINKDVGRDQVEISIGYVGLIPSSYPINAIHQWTGGPEEAILRVALKEGAQVDIDRLKERLRQELAEQMPGVRLSFEPADIVSGVMSFGSPTPVEVAVTGSSLADDRAFAEKLRAELAQIPSLRDLQYGLSLDYPTVSIEIDRERAGLSGVTAQDVARSVVASTSSSRFVVPNYWPDPKTGIGYQVQVEVPYQVMDSLEKVETVPIQKPGLDRQVLLRDVAQVRPGTMPGEYDRYNMKHTVSLTANIFGEDLGRVAGHVERAIERVGTPPKGVTVDIRGQIVPMEEILRGLAIGLGMSIVVILLLLTANFQSVRLALVVVSTTPAVVAGVVVMLWLTGTTVNLQSFMGAIMAIGVAVANAILLVTFAEEHRRAGVGRRGPGRRRGRPGPAPADPDDQLRHDRRHGADGAGLGRGGRADRPARPRRHRRAGRRDARHPDRAAHGLRAGPGQGGPGIGLARPRRSRERALPRGRARERSAGPAFGQRRTARPPAPGPAVGPETSRSPDADPIR